MKIAAIGNFRQHNFAPHWQGIKLGFDELGVDNICLDFKEGEILERIKEFSPDVILGCTWQFLNNRPLFDSLKPLAKTALWYCDYAEPNGEYLGRGNNYAFADIDYLFMSNMEHLESIGNLIGAKRAYFLPQACLPRKSISAKKEEFKKDVIFIGGRDKLVHGRRDDVLEAIRHDIFWYPNDVIPPPLCYEKLPQIYASAKISLSISAYADKNLYTSNRLFLALGNGGFVLVEAFRGMEKMWTSGEHFASFTSPEEATDKIEYYLKHSRKREEIRRQGFDYCQKRHNYIERMKNLISYLEGDETFYGFK